MCAIGEWNWVGSTVRNRGCLQESSHVQIPGSLGCLGGYTQNPDLPMGSQKSCQDSPDLEPVPRNNGLH